MAIFNFVKTFYFVCIFTNRLYCTPYGSCNMLSNWSSSSRFLVFITHVPAGRGRSLGLRVVDHVLPLVLSGW